MNEKQINKSIENNIELRKNLWATTIVLTGGIITILFNLNPISLLKIVLLAIGVGLDVIFISSIIDINKDIHKLIGKLGENLWI